MLNLKYNSAYQYTIKEKRHINSLTQNNEFGKKFKKRRGKNKRTVWYDGKNETKAIKHNISDHLLFKTTFRCSYCSRNLIKIGKPIDHFIPNALFPKYSFHPLNLIQACSFCNTDEKNQFNPVINFHKKYHKIVFSIIHPIIDNVNNHFFFETNEKCSYDKGRCSAKALKMIDIMSWVGIEHNLFLAELSIQNLITDKISDDQFKQLIEKAASYQPKK